MSRTSELFSFPHPVNEKAARSVAGCVALSVAVILALGLAVDPVWLWLTLPLAIGFALRVASGPRFSPYGQLATKIIAPRLGAARLVAGPPKRFAQCIGLAVSTLAFVLGPVLGLTAAAAAVLGVLLIFALLESVVGFCAGCWLFGVLIRAGLVPEATCEACANWRPARS